MKAITIRGIDQNTSDKLKKAANKNNMSVNQFVIDMIKEKLGLKKVKQFTTKYEDLDHLFGKWTQKEYKDIQNRIDTDRKIDKELWE